MGISQLQGSPWHLEQMHRKEGDDRRHKSRCQFYNPLTKQCKDRWKCIGSRYCQEYIQLSEEDFRQRQADITEAKRLLAKGYSSSDVSTSQKQKQKVKKEQQNKAEKAKTKSMANTKTNSIRLPNLQGKYINHKGFGKGLVIDQSGDSIYVNYGGMTKQQKLSVLINNNIIEY